MLDRLASTKGHAVAKLVCMPAVVGREPLLRRAIHFDVPLLDGAVGLNDAAGMKAIRGEEHPQPRKNLAAFCR